MAVVKMQKVAITGLAADREELLDALQDQGVVEISEMKEQSTVDHTEVKFRSAELQFAITTLKDHANNDILRNTKKARTQEDIVKAALHTDVRGIVEELKKLEEIDTEAEAQITEAQTLIDELKPWLSVKGPIVTNVESASTTQLFGTVATAQWTEFEAAVKALPKCLVEKVKSEKAVTHVRAYVWNTDRAEFDKLAQAAEFNEVTLPEVAGDATKLIEQAELEIKELRTKQAGSTTKREQLAVELPNLLKAATYIAWLNAKQGAREAIGETASTITLIGWTPKNGMGALESALQKISPATLISKVKPEEDEEPPVFLKNRRWLKPFESVTNLYGLPAYKEFDPTSSLSAFFIIYFALCLTDAVYGLILILAFGTVLLRKRWTIDEARLIWLLFFCGVVTFIVSIPFGGWMGFTPEQVPAFLTKQGPEGLLFKGQIWNLSEQSGIQFLQNLSLTLGVTHLFYGMFLAGYYKWIHGQRAAALWKDFSSHLLLGVIILYVMSPESYKQMATYALYGAIAIKFWGLGHGHAWYKRPFMSLLGSLDFAMSMTSNVLSYLRILALGLVTSALAMAVNQTAVEVGKLLPIWVAIPVMIMIFVSGHTISVALNSLGSFVHSGRLQFIEFFSQFFEGGGRDFRPFRRFLF